MLLGLLVVVEQLFDYGQFLMDKRSGKERKSTVRRVEERGEEEREMELEEN